MRKPTTADSRVPSITYWLEKLHLISSGFRFEDNTKFERLGILNKIIKIKYLKPKRLSLIDLERPALAKQYDKKLFTWRIIPKDGNAPKFRAVKKTFSQAKRWIKNLCLNAEDYKYIEMIDYLTAAPYSAIFLVNDRGIWGEMIRGHIWRLAHGTHHQTPYYFYFYKNEWHFSKNNLPLQNLIKKALANVKIRKIHRHKLISKLQTKFTADGYLKGYFEIQIYSNGTTLFNDYNRTIYKMMKKFKFYINTKSNREIKGRCAIPGLAIGRIRIVENKKKVPFQKGDVVLCKTVALEHLPFLKKAGAIISERGSTLSHAAIVVRELKKPYIVNVKDALKKLKNGDKVFVNATTGTVTIL